MVGGKKYLYVLLFLCFCFYGCKNNKNKREINAEFCILIDTRIRTDSIDSLYPSPRGMGNCNTRSLNMSYIIRNNSNEDIYLPVKSFCGERTDTADTNIKVYFVNGKDTIYPRCRISRVPYKEKIVSARDSITLKVEISCLGEWSNKDIDVTTDIKTLISKLHLEYCKNPDDFYEDLETPIIKFGTIPQKCISIERVERFLH
jgi:hypothetical protein